MIKKILNFKLKIRKYNQGMTLLELMVVLGIFGLLSLVSIFNYNGLQNSIHITDLSNDIALQVVQAQNASLSGRLPVATQQSNEITNWKPSYGVYFSSTSSADIKGADNKDFIYFTDLNQNQIYDSAGGCSLPLVGECISKYTITNNDSISSIKVFVGSTPTTETNLTITFARPNSGAVFYDMNGSKISTLSYAEITITNNSGTSSTIDLYPSGRVQIN